MQETERRAREMTLRFLRDGSSTKLGAMICSAILSQTNCEPSDVRVGLDVFEELAGDDDATQRDIAALQEFVTILEKERPPISKELSEEEQEIASKMDLTSDQYRHGKR